MAAQKPAAKTAKKPAAKKSAVKKPAVKKTAVKQKAASVVSTAPTAASALAFVLKLGLTESELQAVLAAQDVSTAVLNQLSRVNIGSIAAAFSAEVVGALTAPNASIKVRAAQLSKVSDAAARAQTAAGAVSKMEQSSSVLEHSARADADLLDEVIHSIQPQIVAQSAVDTDLADLYRPVLAYWADRYPGGKKAAPKTPPKP